MDSDCWPQDPQAVYAQVRLVVRELDEANEEDSLTLLSDLLCAAWGSVIAQNQ